MTLTIVERFSETLADGFERLRTVSADQVALRAVVGAAALTACALSDVWTNTLLSPAFLWVSMVCAVAAVVLPSGPVPILVFGAIGLWWWLGGANVALWEPSVIAVLLAVVHIGCALSASGPTHAPLTRSARIAVWRRIGGFAGITAGAAALVWAVSAIPDSLVPRGLAWTAAALVLVLVGGWAALSRTR